MTTPPTPEQTLAEYKHWRNSNGSIGFVDANRLAAACEALLAERDRLKTELADTEMALLNTRNFSIERTCERDRLKAQLGVTVETLEDLGFWRCGCGATFSGDKAHAALAKIKDLT